MEDSYNYSNKFLNSFNNYIQNFYNTIVSRANKLDKDSVFKEYFKSQMNNILGGNESINVVESVSVGKNELLKVIDEHEEKIAYERRKICDYNNKISELRQELASAI